ncbi:MAG: hypothetical protein ACFCVG_17275 [Kineosporiaceae bacterium]
MPVDSAYSVFGLREPLLPQVVEPVQDIGGELDGTASAAGRLTGSGLVPPP